MRAFRARILRLRSGRVAETARTLRRRSSIDPRVRRIAERIVLDVKKYGDPAVRKWTYRLDGAFLGRLSVTEREMHSASAAVSPENIEALRFAAERLHRQAKRELTLRTSAFSQCGIRIERTLKPLLSAGCYVPGGSAAYPSSLLMSAIPAAVARVSRVVACSPPRPNGSVNPLVAVASEVCEIDEFYKIGGPQAIAAMAYGTKTIEPVDKIVGPGGPYVLAAKQIIANDVAIDLPAGPTELLVIAFGEFDANFLARDVIAQAEHSPWSICGVVTDSLPNSKRIVSALSRALEMAPRNQVVSKALWRSFFVCIAGNLSDATEFANTFAPEHAHVMGSARDSAEELRTSGLVLVGDYSTSAASDYAVGTSHILPTGGFARSCSSLSVWDFLRRQEIVSCTRKGLQSIAWPAIRLARAEGLDNHALAILERFKK